MPHRFGYIPDTPDIRDHKFLVPRVMRLPRAVDLRDHAKPLPILDQGELGSCTAHGSTMAMRLLRQKQGLDDIEMARLQVYYDARALEGSTKSDAGAMIRDVVKAIVKKGAGHEDLWPYDVARFATRPPKAVYASALGDHVVEYQRVDVNSTAVKTAIAQHMPVVIGISVYDSFESEATAETGIVAIPKKTESLLGGHCMVVVGYGQKTGYFTVQNSWSDAWGDKGFCYIPYKYLDNPDLGADYWALKTVG